MGKSKYTTIIHGSYIFVQKMLVVGYVDR